MNTISIQFNQLDKISSLLRQHGAIVIVKKGTNNQRIIILKRQPTVDIATIIGGTPPQEVPRLLTKEDLDNLEIEQLQHLGEIHKIRNYKRMGKQKLAAKLEGKATREEIPS
ncbi:hypothetical protein [Iningainema tapete]|uniref:Uncharacterized protein n=1 Tax=Iningainema tapete BLCC-T55 TaxID=2748662 RepID=A0A8J6XKF6_9CYAN|nr:hypothetical protein [Iningainema tapete]MBD2772042.1 hypothetical protein [Iningainema tapete BLCC-T55]